MQFQSWLILSLIVAFGTIVNGFASDTGDIPNTTSETTYNSLLQGKSLTLDRVEFESAPINVDVGINVLSSLTDVKQAILLEYDWFTQAPLNFFRYIYLAYYSAFLIYTGYDVSSRLLTRMTRWKQLKKI